ncbi:Acyl transferase [Thalictrum thalictroides]|uniref:Acyl transferase n=1 Tax=Thalictrum thalictroides TaxID=46969 RepID=A0A7J6XES7_THATH|nr:Acyl transferase [Thalictrum thalictroides]
MYCQQLVAASVVNQSSSFLPVLSKSRTFQVATSTSSPPCFSRSMKSSNLVFCPHATKCSSMPSLTDPTTIDLKLTIQRCSTVVPWKETEKRIMFLSDLEQYLNINFGTISFFSANSNFPPETVVDKLEIAFRKALVYYDYLAGRLRFNSEEGRLEIDCNSAGAGFVVISSELSMADLGDLVSSSPSFQQLETMRPEKCLFVMQVIMFKCGGFAITTCINHVTLDGWSLQMFLNNLTSLLANDEILSTPNNDRQLLSAQPPTHLTFPHLQGINLDLAPKAFQVKSLKPESKVYRLSPDNIMKLKEKAMENGKRDSTGAGFSTFKVVTAHIWRCKGLARNAESDPDKKSTIHFPVHMRPRLQNPPLPLSYTGNVTIDAPWTTTRRELEQQPFSQLVEMVSNAVSKITEEHIRSIIESGEWLSGFPHGDVIVSSWMTLGFNDVEYPWGTAKCTCPLPVSDWNDIIIMLPAENSDGVNIVVTLPPDEMAKFQTLFHKL